MANSDRRVEFDFYRSFADSAVPVPRPLFLETDPELAGAAVLRHGAHRRLRVAVPGPARARLRAASRRSGAAHVRDPRRHRARRRSRHCRRPRAAPSCRRRTRAGSASSTTGRASSTRNELEPQPIVARRHPLAAPPSAAAAAARGGRARRLPHRQLPLPRRRDPRRSSTGRWRTSAIRSRTSPGRSCPPGSGRATARPAASSSEADAIRIWEARSGLRVDPPALHWWKVFSCVKAQGIWLTGAREFAEGRATGHHARLHVLLADQLAGPLSCSPALGRCRTTQMNTDPRRLHR